MFPEDEKGRSHVSVMSDRELLEEIALSQRATRDLVEKFIADMASNPMFRMFATKIGK